MFGDDNAALYDLMEGLFHIAMADGNYHPNENEFLARVSEIFDLGENQFRRMRARFVPDAVPDPYSILGVSEDASIKEIRTAWRKLVHETHPDRMIARGVPEEAMKLAESRMAAINQAWEKIQEEHG